MEFLRGFSGLNHNRAGIAQHHLAVPQGLYYWLMLVGDDVLEVDLPGEPLLIAIDFECDLQLHVLALIGAVLREEGYRGHQHQGIAEDDPGLGSSVLHRLGLIYLHTPLPILVY